MQLEFDLSTSIITLEEWRTVQEFPNYEVSNFGRFRNLKTKRYLGGTLNWTGYLHVSLSKNKRSFTRLMHRIVAETFLEPPSPEHFIVNHKNTVRSDNKVSNLEWNTRSQNSTHGWYMKKSRNRGVNGTSEPSKGLAGVEPAQIGRKGNS